MDDMARGVSAKLHLDANKGHAFHQYLEKRSGADQARRKLIGHQSNQVENSNSTYRLQNETDEKDSQEFDRLAYLDQTNWPHQNR